jgi:O-antigen/teichoic acid export membrane protein
VIEGSANAGFILYLAWLSSSVYGEVMYALAGAYIVLKVVQFGLYYPLVAALGREDDSAKPEILNRVNTIKIVFFVLTTSCLVGFGIYKDFSAEMMLIFIFVCSGFGLDAFAETFFADLRVRGRQDQEARIRIAGTILGYGFGFACGIAGLHPIFMSLFAFVSAVVKLVIATVLYKRTYSAGLFMRPEWPPLWTMFRASTTFALIEILGILYNKTNIFFLESAVGVQGVAYYSSTWIIVDNISTLVSDQLLGWVIFPLLASIWWTNRDRAERLIHSNAKWLMILAFPIMFFLHVESELVIGIAYPAEYANAAWMQKFLVWTILLSFENNLFFYVMMVAGGANALLLFSVIVTLLNLLLNLTLVKPLGLMGGCLVIIMTKLIMALLTFFYCQVRFRFFALTDALFPLILAAASLGLFVVSKPIVGLHPAVAVTVVLYFLVLWRVGERFLGPLPARGAGEA